MRASLRPSSPLNGMYKLNSVEKCRLGMVAYFILSLEVEEGGSEFNAIFSYLASLRLLQAP